MSRVDAPVLPARSLVARTMDELGDAARLYGGLAVAAVLLLASPISPPRGVRMLILVLLFHACALGIALTRQPAGHWPPAGW